MSSIFGHTFKVSTFGESHGKSMGCIIDGCPSNIPISLETIQSDLQRRRPGQSKITTPRNEADTVHLQSGVFENKTLGTPICLLIENQDTRSQDYAPSMYRPSHAEFTYDQKYQHRDWRGGGRASARETVARVAAGSLAKQVLQHHTQIECIAWVEQIGPIQAEIDENSVTQEAIEGNIVRCPDPKKAQEMQEYIETVRKEKDSVGGIIRCICKNVPIGLGEPVFDKLEADLAKAMMSIPATKGFSIGSGFSCVHMKGSEHNDIFTQTNGNIHTKTNHSGGIQGGISNGMPITFSVAFKPVATIAQAQDTVDTQGNPTTIEGKGRHDPCVLPRAVPIVEAMAYLVLVDHWLRNRTAHIST